MNITGFKSKDGTVHKYDYNALVNKPVIPGDSGSGGDVELDTTLTQSGKAADAKVVGDRLDSLNAYIYGSERTVRVTDEGSTETYYPASGIERTLAGAHTSPAIPLNGYQFIEYRGKISKDFHALVLMDSSGTVMLDSSVRGDGTSTLKYYTGTIPIPEGAAYARVTCYEATDGYIRAYTVEGLSEKIANLEKGVLKDKKIAFLGDSITSTYYGLPTYWQLIAERTGCECLNYAMRQSRFATVESDAVASFLTRAANMDATADAVFVMGGTNDVEKSSLLGEWDSYDETTLYGGLNALITLLQTNYPGKPIIFATPIKRTNDKGNAFPETMETLRTASATASVSMQQCVLAIKAKCAQYSIPVIDIAEHSGIGANCTEYFCEDDRLHPTSAGHVRIANMVHEELEKQFRYTVE